MLEGDGGGRAEGGSCGREETRDSGTGEWKAQGRMRPRERPADHLTTGGVVATGRGGVGRGSTPRDCGKDAKGSGFSKRSNLFSECTG